MPHCGSPVGHSAARTERARWNAAPAMITAFTAQGRDEPGRFAVPYWNPMSRSDWDTGAAW